MLRRKRVGFVFQDHNLIPNLSLIENILLAGYLLNENRRTVYNRALEIMKDLEIELLAQRLPAQISGGERQRCAIARALINKPDIVFGIGGYTSGPLLLLASMKKIHTAILEPNAIAGVTRNLTGQLCVKLKQRKEMLPVSESYVHLFKQM